MVFLVLVPKKTMLAVVEKRNLSVVDSLVEVPNANMEA